MTIVTLIAILGTSLAIVVTAVAIDVISAYRREMRLEKAVAESNRALELARQTETTIMLTVISQPKPKGYVGKHRLVAC